MSSVEEITSEMRRIIMKSRSLEAKLEQSVPKKTYQDAVQKMQAAIDKLSEDLARTKDKLAETESLGGRINSLSAQLAVLSSQVSNQNDAVKGLTTEYSVPREVHSKAVARIRELEHTLETKNSEETVPRSEYEALQAHVAELDMRLADSVPKAQYSRLIDEISGLISIRSEALMNDEPTIIQTISSNDHTPTATLTDFASSIEEQSSPSSHSEILEIQSSLSQIKGTTESERH